MFYFLSSFHSSNVVVHRSGKCIGEKNLKAFNLFIQMLCIQFYYLLGSLIYFLIYHFVIHSLPHGPSF